MSDQDSTLDRESVFERELAALRRDFIAGLEARRRALLGMVETLNRGPDPRMRESLRLEVHTLAGTALTFRLSELGDAAKTLEKRMLDGGGARSWRAEFQELNRALQAVCDQNGEA